MSKQPFKLTKEELSSMLRNSILGYLHEHGDIPHKVIMQQQIFEEMSKLYSFDYNPLILQRVSDDGILQEAILQGKWFGLGVAITTEPVLFKLK
jgi:hypothetical protein